MCIRDRTNSAPVVLPVQPDIPDPLVDQPAPVDLPVEPEQPEPVQVPVHWQSDNMEVFTSTGVERFEQEVQSANNMLNTLNQTQSRIAAQAAQTDLFPDNAIADMNNMQNRLQAIQQRIQTIESNPLNMGSDTANAELEQLRGQLDQAVQEQEALNRAVENMDVEAANQAYLRLSQTVGNTERYIRDNVDEQGRFNREIEEGTNEANSLMQTIKGAVAAYAEHGTRACNAKKMRKADLDEAVLSTIQAQLDLFVDMQDSLHQLLAMKKAMAKQNGQKDEIKSLQKKLDHKKGLFGGLYRDLREGLISDEDYAQTREVILGEIKRLEKQLAELEGTTNRFEEQLRGEKKWAELVKKYHHATEVTAEMVDAMIVSMKMNKDSSLSIEFNHMDEFKAIYDTIDILRKEVA